MNTPDIARPQGMPAYIATQFEIGLETGLRADRVLALELANRFDIANDVQAGLGLQVVEAYMQQRGKEFDLSPKPRRHIQWKRTLETPRGTGMVAAASRAIGSTIAVETVIHELLDAPTMTVAITTPGTKEELSLLSPAVDTDSMEVDEGKPYLIHQRFLRDASFANFFRAIFGLGDLGGLSSLTLG